MLDKLKIKHLNNDDSCIIESSSVDLYSYTVHVRQDKVDIPKGSSGWVIRRDEKLEVVRGGTVVVGSILCVVIHGYNPNSCISSIDLLSNLPYVNGCSTHQVFPPIRPGDPTMQLLYLPRNTKEQAHHIHSTTRIVYILEGKGVSVQGMSGDVVKPLMKGDVLIMDKMTPHHFETTDSELIVIPIHIYSAISTESSHPMTNGTILV